MLLDSYIEQGLYNFSKKKKISRTFPWIFLDSDWLFQDSKFPLKPFHSQDFKINSPNSQQNISYNINSENFITKFKQIFRTFQDFPDLENVK